MDTLVIELSARQVAVLVAEVTLCLGLVSWLLSFIRVPEEEAESVDNVEAAP